MRPLRLSAEPDIHEVREPGRRRRLSQELRGKQTEIIISLLSLLSLSVLLFSLALSLALSLYIYIYISLLSLLADVA